MSGRCCKSVRIKETGLPLIVEKWASNRSVSAEWWAPSLCRIRCKRRGRPNIPMPTGDGSVHCEPRDTTAPGLSPLDPHGLCRIILTVEIVVVSPTQRSHARAELWSRQSRHEPLWNHTRPLWMATTPAADRGNSLVAPACGRRCFCVFSGIAWLYWLYEWLCLASFVAALVSIVRQLELSLATASSYRPGLFRQNLRKAIKPS